MTSPIFLLAQYVKLKRSFIGTVSTIGMEYRRRIVLRGWCSVGIYVKTQRVK